MCTIYLVGRGKYVLGASKYYPRVVLSTLEIRSNARQSRHCKEINGSQRSDSLAMLRKAYFDQILDEA